MSENYDAPLPRQTIYLIIWSVIFGTALAVGGSVLEPIPIPMLGVALASPYVALVVTLNKLVVFRQYSVTYMYLVAGCIAIFTTYLGPPNILKPLFLLAGLSFDAATFFRANEIKFWNICLGHLAITISGFLIFWVLFAISVPGSSDVIGKAILVMAPIHFVLSLPIAYAVFKFASPSEPPLIVKTIRAQINGS